MKHLIALPILFLFLTQLVHAQKFDRYCEVQGYDKSWKKNGQGNWSITLVTGQADSLFGWKDPAVLTTLNKVTGFPTDIDALNYMSSIGWNLVAVTTVGAIHHFFFKRTFDAAELKRP